jgi:hypothetical protein
MSKGAIIQCFLDADMRNGHEGLAELAKKENINVQTLQRGQFVVFINSAKDRVKIYAASNVIAYMRSVRGQKIDLRVIREIPRAFNGGGISYDETIEKMLSLKMAQRPKAVSPLQAARAMRA